MVSSFRHSRNGRARSASRMTNSSEGASQRTTADHPSSQRSNATRSNHSLQPAKQRGRKQGSLTKLKMPQRGRKVVLEPLGDMQFDYVGRKKYKYTSQLGVIIKREYPGLVKDKDEHGVLLNTRPALEWADYFLSEKDDLGRTAGDRVLSEFWRLFEVKRGQEEQADRVLENYLRKRVRDMMYQARVDAVKMYYKNKLNQNLDDKLARPIELNYEEYLDGKLKWCNEAVWPYLCRYWCSKVFLIKRKRGQESRLCSDDIAQNRGGSRPFGETRQVLAEQFGPEFATIINTYSVMKSGIKNVDDNCQIGTTISRKAKNIVDDYTAKCKAAHPEDPEQQELDGKVLYDVSGGLPHGRLAIAHGAIRKADVISAAKEKNVIPSNSASHRRMAKENRHLRHSNRRLHERLDQLGELTNDLILNLYRDLGKEVPENLQSRLSALQANLPTSSSDVGEEIDSEDTDGEYMDGDDFYGDESDGEDMDEEQIDDEGEGEGDANIGSNNGGSNEMP